MNPMLNALRGRRGRGISVEILLGGETGKEGMGNAQAAEEEMNRKTGLAPKSSMSRAPATLEKPVPIAETEDEMEGDEEGYKTLTKGMQPEELEALSKREPNTIRERAIMDAKKRMSKV